jgi:hypothetical protein
LKSRLRDYWLKLGLWFREKSRDDLLAMGLGLAIVLAFGTFSVWHIGKGLSSAGPVSNAIAESLLLLPERGFVETDVTGRVLVDGQLRVDRDVLIQQEKIQCDEPISTSEGAYYTCTLELLQLPFERQSASYLLRLRVVTESAALPDKVFARVEVRNR